jgi:predicted ABC-type ATPase
MWVLAGANGSGKSTFYRLMLEPRGVRWINADDIARTLWPADPERYSYAAAAIAADQREAAIRAGC